MILYVSKQQVKFSQATETSITIVHKRKKIRNRLHKISILVTYFSLYQKERRDISFCFVTIVQNTHIMDNTAIHWI